MLSSWVGLIGSVSAWGPDGHSIVAEIASSLLKPSGAAFVKGILGEATMASVANWADEIRQTSQGAWSGPLHFADLPEKNCHFERTRDCPADFCVASAIANYSSRVGNPASESQHEDIKFLIHFVGDAHQPLHAGFVSDRGGNLVHVSDCFVDADTCHKNNLHSVWDTTLLVEGEGHKSANSSDRWYDAAQAMIQKLSEPEQQENVSMWANTCSADYNYCANSILIESGLYACESSYISTSGSWIQNGDHLNRDYYDTRYAVVRNRLMAAGVRLASIIDKIASSANERASSPIIDIFDI